MAAYIQVDAILPAGGRITGDFAREAGTEIKALIRFNGTTLLARAIYALRDSGRVGRIVVIGGEEARREAIAHGAEGILPEGATGPDNILRGLAWLNSPAREKEWKLWRVLVVTTDLPFLTPDALVRFLDACPYEADVCVPAVTKEAFQARFPGSQNEYVPLRDGQFTIGSAFLVNRDTLLKNQAHLERLFAARKSQWQMARLVGPEVALRLLTKRLSVAHIVARASKIAQCRGHAVFNSPPELAYDIDQPEEFRYAVQHMEAGDAGGDAPVGADPPASFAVVSAPQENRA